MTEQPLQAHSWAEIHYYLLVTPCPNCGQGPWHAASTGETAGQAPSPFAPGAAHDATTPPAVDVAAVCQACGTARTFGFVGAPPAPASPAADVQPINPSDHPSRIIDVGQWISLFHFFLEAAARETGRPASRRLGYQASQCLAEALKFYTDDQLPPDTAVFTDASRAAFRDHPERFARQRLRDMQAKLPPLSKMARCVAEDRQHAKRQPWWKLWDRTK